MKNIDVQKFYSKKALSYQKIFLDFFNLSKGIYSFFNESDYLFQNIKILDAGCGSGNLTINLDIISKEKNISGIQFNAFDLTPAMLKMFSRWINDNSINNIELQQVDVLELNRLPEEWNNYDLIVSSGMLEYLPKNKIKEAILGIKGLLKKEGTLLIFLSKKNIIMKLLIEIWWKANLYKKEEISEILKQSGFSNIQFKKFTKAFEYLNLWGHVIEAKQN